MKKIIKNAKIYTLDEKQPWADFMVIDGETIEYIGEEKDYDWAALTDAAHDAFDLGKKMIIPGFIDSHIHPGMVSQSAWHVKLPWTNDVNEVLTFIKDYAKKHPKEEVPFLYFEYYPTNMFGTEGPAKELLDQAVCDRPCLCQDFGEHLHWVNSKMLEYMEVTKDTKDPIPGLQMFVRNENGEATGWLKELVWLRFADKLFANMGWEPPMVMTPEIMLPFFEFLNEHGITAIADGICEGEAQAQSMYELDQIGKLNTYYDGIVRFDSLEELPDKIKTCKEWNKKYASKHIKFNTMKLFLDGTNESGNSGSLHPHVNDPTGTNYGEILMEVDELTNVFILCNEEGVDAHLHIVGDRTFRVACDAVEAAKKDTALRNRLWQIKIIFAHCEIVDTEDFGRPKELGITINWSCHWSGGYFGEEAKNFYTEEKWNRMYQFNPIIDSGALVTFSSDVVTFYELHRADPFFSMQVAGTRVDPEFPLDSKRFPGSVRPPENARISRENLMKGYTINGARQMHLENIMGSLEKGKLANILVLSDDFFKVSPEHIKDISIETVIFEGKVLRGRL